jgi:hypothetical protein
MRNSGQSRFTRPREIDRARRVSDSTPAPKLTVTDHDALLLWNGTGRGLRAAHEPFADDTRLGRGRPGAVALREHGTALATWVHDGRVLAALARPGDAFGRPEPVSDRTEAEHISAAFDASGRPIVTWTAGATRLSATRAAP